MTTNTCTDSKYVVMVCIVGAFLVIGSAVKNFSVIDLVYIVFIVGCLIRYLYINSKEE